MIELYTAATPNGWKASVALEELGLAYNVNVVSLSDGDQHSDAFRAINPNGKIPAIVDTDNDNFAVMESGAILIYLAEKAGKLLPTDVKGRSEVIQWLMFQIGGIGPMMGQANVFYRYFPEKIQPAIDRYQNECRRLFEVLDKHLADREYLAGEYSIADIANFCWVRTHKWSGVSVEGLDNLMAWSHRVGDKPGVIRGMDVPTKLDSLVKDDSDEDREKFVKNAQKMVTR